MKECRPKVPKGEAWKFQLVRETLLIRAINPACGIIQAQLLPYDL